MEMQERSRATIGKKVLVVDDEHDFLSIMDYYLTAEGYEVEVAHDGAEALRSVGTSPPDLILLDLVMPGMDGLSAMKKLRGMAAPREIPVILLSILDQPEHDTGPLNVTGYVVKPFSPEFLMEKIRQTLTS